MKRFGILFMGFVFTIVQLFAQTPMYEKPFYTNGVSPNRFGEVFETSMSGEYNENMEYVGSALWTGIYGMEVRGDYAYCLFYNGLGIFDISNPVEPVFVSKVYCEGQSRAENGIGLFISEDFAYIAAGYGGLHIININDPINPEHLGNFNHPEPHVNWMEFSYKVSVKDNYAFVTTGDHGIQIIDISNPIEPSLVLVYEFVDLNLWPIGIGIFGDYAYVTGENESNSTLEILDISNPENPVEVSSYDLGEFGKNFDLYVSNHMVYTCNQGLFRIIDCSNPSQPVEIGNCNVTEGFSTYDIFVDAGIAYVVNSSGLHIIDITNPETPIVVEENYNSGSALAVTANTNEIFLANSRVNIDLSVFQIIDKGSFQVIGTADLPQGEKGLNDVVEYNGLIYALDDEGLYVLSSVGRNDLGVIGYVETPGRAQDVKIDGSFAYVADGSAGLSIIDISDVANPVIAASCNTPGDANDLAIKNGTAYVADGPGKLQIIDISDPFNPSIINGFTSFPASGCFGICLVGNYACLACLSDGMSIIDISNPSAPNFVAAYQSPTTYDHAEGVCKIDDTHVCLAEGFNGLHIIDISDIDNPVLVSNYSTNDLDVFLNVMVVGNFAYTTNWYNYGIDVVNISDLSNPTFAGTYFLPNNNPWSCYAVDNGMNKNVYVADRYSLIILNFIPQQVGAVINVEPQSIAQTLAINEIATQSLIIENSGEEHLEYEVNLNQKSVEDSQLCTEGLYVSGCSYGNGLSHWECEEVNIYQIPCEGTLSWYHDYTSMNHEFEPGETYTVVVQSGLPTNFSNTTYLDIWIDFDDNLELTGNELVLNDGYLENGSTNYNFDITIPSDANPGSHIMRIRTNRLSPVTDPCDSYIYGNCIDFTATIGGSTPSDWLSADITSGTIEPGQSQEITLTFNSEGLENGTYEKTISISSNDPENPVVEVPVTLNVIENTQPWDVTITGLIHTIVVPTEANPNIYGILLEVGDWMGVFFENEDGNLQCGGSAMMESSGNIVVIAYGDDPTTEAKDGFGEGENFVWKLYSQIYQEAYPARAWYDETMPNQGNFHNFGLSKLTSLASIYCQSYMFNEGWNSMSSFINPATPDVQQLMSPVEDDLIILQNLTSVYWPSQGVNTIGNFNTESGYAVKFEETTSFELCGPSYVENQIMLNQGWHYLPVLSACEVNTFDLFGNIMSEIVIVQDLIGENVFWPEMNIFTLETLEPGRAYKIKLSSDALITFPVCELNYSTNTKQVSKKVTQKWGNMTLTPTTQVTALLSQSLSQFTTGDEIGAFGENGKLYGFTIVKGIDQNDAIVLNGDDTLTPSVLDGFLEAEPVSFKLYRPSTGEEFDLVAAYSEEMNNPTGNYYASSFAAIESFSLVGIDEQNSNQIHLYPNPASGFVVVRIEGKNVSPTQISIFDSKGRLVLSEVTSSTISLDISKLAAGVYQVQCQNERNLMTRKLIISAGN